jgi:hypothetical protein
MEPPRAADDRMMSTMPDTLPPGTTHALPPLPAGWRPLNYAALADGSLAILGTDVDLRSARSRAPDGAPSPASPFALAQRAAARLWTFDGQALVEGPAFPLASPYLLVDRFADGRWLVARRFADPDRGERILSPDGDPLGSIYLGDGVAHLKIDDAGRIWVGWIDEGIFGNGGWRIPGRDGPPSQSGLACFDEHGHVIREAPRTDPPIDDCYALNVSGATAWACTYAGFPILALERGADRRWSTSLSGTSALAIDGDHLLAAGGYGDDGTRLTLLRLGESAANVVRKGRLPFLPTAPRSADAPFLDGRGDKLHLVHRGTWHRWSVGAFCV